MQTFFTRDSAQQMRTTGQLPWLVSEDLRRRRLQSPPLGSPQYVTLGQEQADTSTKVVVGGGLLLVALLTAGMWWVSQGD